MPGIVVPLVVSVDLQFLEVGQFLEDLQDLRIERPVARPRAGLEIGAVAKGFYDRVCDIVGIRGKALGKVSYF